MNHSRITNNGVERPVPRTWRWCTVGDVAQGIDYGHTARAKDTQKGPRFLRITDITPHGVDWDKVPGCDIHDRDLGRFRLHRDDLLFARIGSVGKSYLIRDCPEAVFASYLIRVRLAEGFEPRFVFAYFQTSEYWSQITEVQQGIGRPVVNGTKLAALRLPVAPLAEQSRIADRIDELFTDLAAGVAALERVKRNLSRYRAAVLHAAVTGRLTEAWRKEHGPAAEPGPKLLERILAERRRQWELRTLAKYEKEGKSPPKNWRDRYVEPSPPKPPADGSPLPVLPEGWCWASVAQAVSEGLCNGISVKGSDSPPGVAALKLNAMSDRGFDYSAIRFIPISSDAAEENLVHEGDFFVSRGNGSLHLLARGTVAQAPPHQVVFPDTMIRLRLCAEVSWLPTVWPSRLVRSQIERMAKTTAGIYKVSQSDLESLVIPLPPASEQVAIVEAVNEKLSQIDALEAEVARGLDRAGRLRQAILKAAFEGRLVPQDPDDEPANVLLERIRSEAAEAKPKPKQRRKPSRKAVS